MRPLRALTVQIWGANIIDAASMHAPNDMIEPVYLLFLGGSRQCSSSPSIAPYSLNGLLRYLGSFRMIPQSESDCIFPEDTNMKLKSIALLLSAALISASSYASTNVNASSALVDLGSFSAGQYSITATGVVDLVGSGNTFQMNPDGTPNSTVTAPNYSYFNPNGSYTADNNYGPAGANAKIGALVGTFSSNPTQPSDWFLIGYSKVVTLSSTGHIYAQVNDTYPSNNTGSFSVTVTAVPEPETYVMLLVGLGLMGGIARRRSKAM